MGCGRHSAGFCVWIPSLLAEELDDSGLHGILRADDHETVLPDELLEHLRPMPQMIHRGLDVRACRLLHERIRVSREIRPEQAFDRWPHALDYRGQIARLVLRRTSQLLERRRD